ncbi:3-ketosteroid dehydrogenase [Defluviimonas sp. 20V17]|uniref:Fumarate reductase flavoprotein subunit n=1 Tax=Allgaiera indica TaxID=765699 RepID=A0AAN4USK2_9RHOB|nr:FAD-dependent oxidoreductase [Allgaiera indica]KDB01992.1 3-ketosteroid dehydrogenase [Defluviimonas sp. 20V17]GHE03249.1 fumarate reductase flavoprotein subunit [Allgaiera indica]SDX22297.1 fumarate reductase flavoprotein subunit [Allgaiera indica]
MSRILPPPDRFDLDVGVLVVGAGAAGMVAALRLAEAGAETLVLERDPRPAGSTAMSSGFIPAAGTAAQARAGVADSAVAFAADIRRKNGGHGDARLADLAARTIGPTLDWLAARHGLEWELLTDFLYPGHSAHRMHAVPERNGAGLLARLGAAVAAEGVPVATGAHVTALYARGRQVLGARVTRPDGRIEAIGCGALVLACSGYGGDRDLVARHIPAMATAPYFGHPGNRGDALLWGQALGAAVADLSGCQGHGSVAHPHGVLITWALMSEGGIQVNAEGRRFADESRGYSEQALDVLAQPGGIAWCVFDERLLELARAFPDFRTAESAGAVLKGANAVSLARAAGLPAGALAETLGACMAHAQGRGRDRLGRDFTIGPALAPPFYAVRVTGALFHSQGGLRIDDRGRVLAADGGRLPNLFAAGGAAQGVSGPDPAGYLSGNGLLSAMAFGALAGQGAAAALR